MALLIVALVSSLAVSMAFWFQLSLARGENRWHGAQAASYLLGAESMAAYLLKEDLGASKIDHRGEDWAREGIYFPVNERGDGISPALFDAQGRLNLNSLGDKINYNTNSFTAEFSKLSGSQKMFVRLLQSFEKINVTPQEATAILEAVVDWLDTDANVSGSGGAELYDYQQREPAYRPANQFFFSVSELRLVKGITAELFAELEPLLAVLPEQTSLNINTAPVQLLRALGEKDSDKPLSEADASLLDEARQALIDANSGDKQGFESVDDFWAAPEAKTIFASDQTDNDGLTVASDYFVLRAESSVEKQRRRLESLLYRDGNDNTVNILRRSGL